MQRILRAPAAALVLLLLAVGAPASTAKAGDTPLPPSCEPSAELTLGARVLSQSLHAGRGEIEVELMLDSLVELGSAELRFAGAPGRSLESDDLPSQMGPQAGGTRRTIQGTIELPDGSAEEISFRVEARDAAGRPFEADASVRVDFDPSRQPVLKGDVLEYRAGRQGN